jgi:hypothetical protein
VEQGVEKYEKQCREQQIRQAGRGAKKLADSPIIVGLLWLNNRAAALA